MNKIQFCSKQPKLDLKPNPPFGTQFGPHLLRMELKLDGNNSYAAEIVPFHDQPFSPGTAVLHYGQSIFEGMKAFRQKDGSVAVFRPDLHASRFRKSANRMVMADLPEEVFINCIKEYVRFEAESVPDFADHSLYLRPLLIGTDPKIKMGSSQKYLFYIMSTVAGNYFSASGKITPARVLVNREFVRAYPGGLGEVKTAANYAASIWPQRHATQKECDQVLYLDARQHDNIDDLGGMNFFAIKGTELLTPVLNGCILHGATRRSILEIAGSLGLTPRELPMSFSELRRDIEKGVVTEAFACGTAAVVHPIGEFVYQETLSSAPERIKFASEPKASLKILDRIKAIQRGTEPAPANWMLNCTKN